jgi:hypothetical protein
MALRLFKVSRHNKGNYDTYEEFIVATLCEQDAREIHPNGYHYDKDNLSWYSWDSNHQRIEESTTYGTWINPNEIHLLKVEYIGDASKTVGCNDIIMSVFYAG